MGLVSCANEQDLQHIVPDRFWNGLSLPTDVEVNWSQEEEQWDHQPLVDHISNQPFITPFIKSWQLFPNNIQPYWMPWWQTGWRNVQLFYRNSSALSHSQPGNRAALMPFGDLGPPGWGPPSRDAKGVQGEGNGEGPSLLPIRRFGERRKLPQRGPGRSASLKQFWYIFCFKEHVMERNCLKELCDSLRSELIMPLPAQQYTIHAHITPPPGVECIMWRTHIVTTDRYSIPSSEYAPFCLWCRSKKIYTLVARTP